MNSVTFYNTGSAGDLPIKLRHLIIGDRARAIIRILDPAPKRGVAVVHAQSLLARHHEPRTKNLERKASAICYKAIPFYCLQAVLSKEER
jgi:hypothetical protein